MNFDKHRALSSISSSKGKKKEEKKKKTSDEANKILIKENQISSNLSDDSFSPKINIKNIGRMSVTK
jgi:hypothetical protein